MNSSNGGTKNIIHSSLVEVSDYMDPFRISQLLVGCYISNTQPLNIKALATRVHANCM